MCARRILWRFGTRLRVRSLRRKQPLDVGQQLQAKCRLRCFYLYILSCHKQMASGGGGQRSRGSARPQRPGPGLPGTGA